MSVDQEVLAHDLTTPRTQDVILEENVTFSDLLLSTNVLTGLKANGFHKPSPIQFKSIPIGRCGFDLIVQAKSGTGKTLVFGILALETVDPTEDCLQSLILAPSREIALQIANVLKRLKGSNSNLKVETFIGGMPLNEDIRKAANCHIAVGTPGRIKQLLHENHMIPAKIGQFILDEADKLMETSFQKDITTIYNKLPTDKQILAVSATFPNDLKTFLNNYMLSPTHITDETQKTPLLLGLKQFIYVLDGHLNVAQETKYKNEALIEFLSKVSFAQCVVFTKYASRAESICNVLRQKGWNSRFLSANLSQNKRNETIQDLKTLKCRILLSTDVVARGLDVSSVDLVINYDSPYDPATYVHRMGRAGRYGSQGICITFLLDGADMQMFQNTMGTIAGTQFSIPRLPQTGIEYDLWTIDPSKFDQIHGTVNDAVKTAKNTDLKVIREKLVTSKSTKRPINVTEHDNSDKCSGSSAQAPQIDSVATERYIKHTALLDVSQILQNATKSVPNANCSAINSFLTMLKEKDDLSRTPAKPDTPIETDPTTIDEIFKCAYDSATQQTTKNWQTYVGKNDLRYFEESSSSADETSNNCIEDTEMDEEEIEPDEILQTYDDEEEVDDKYHEQRNFDRKAFLQSTTDEDSAMATETQTQNSNHLNQYRQMYENCSLNLWQTGSVFTDVTEFDQWFSQWKQNVILVRNYVQQNIYLDEMREYSESKMH